MTISKIFIERPVATSLLMAGILLVGAVSYSLLPVAPLPQTELPTVQILAELPNASPETMATSVTQPLERQFGQIPGILQMTSSSTLGNSAITVQFDLSRQLNGAAQDIQTAIDAASGQLPKDLPSPPTYRKVNPSDPPILVLAVTSDTLPLTAVDDYAENVLVEHLSQISGVGVINIGGQQKPSVRIQLDPAKLASLSLSLEGLRTVLATVTSDMAKGTINGPIRAFTIYDNDQELKAAAWSDIVVTYKNGAPVRVRDIGRAIAGPENTLLAAWANGKQAILLKIYKLPQANVIETVGLITAGLPQLRAAIPPAIKIDILSDHTRTIRASITDVQRTLILAVALVVLAIFVFLRNLWATVVPGVAVPLAIVGTFPLIYLFGYSVDNLSLMALTIAVGFVVDDAIVMIENIERHVEAGLSPMEAAAKGAGEIAFTIVSISLSLIAVFIPLLLMGGVVGRLFREFAVTVTITILVSALVSLSLSPMMCSRLLRDARHVRHGRLYVLSERGFDLLLAGYRKSLDVALRHQPTTLGIFLATVVATGYLFVTIPKGFFPQQDTGLIIGVSEAAQDVSFAEMANRARALGAVVSKDPAVASVAMNIGAGPAQTQNMGYGVITLKPRRQRDASADEVIKRLRPQLAKVEGAVLFMQAAQDINIGGRLARTQYQYTLQDTDLSELTQWAPKILSALKQLSELRDLATDQQTLASALTLTIDRDQAARFGIQPQLIDDTLRDAFGQRHVTQYYTQLNSYWVIMEVLPEMQKSPDALDYIYVNSPLTGKPIQLSNLVKWTQQPTAFLSINHQNLFPAVTLSFNLASGVALGQAVEAIKRAQAGIAAPASLIGSFQGNAQAFQASLASEPYLVAVAIIVIYIILGVLYESYIHPLTILSTLPSAGLGALLTLIVFGFDFSLIALIGIILLIGIVKKNGIMLVDFAIEEQRSHGLAPVEAIRKACLLRFRPIMMTTTAAIFGGVPLMLGTGAGTEIRQPLGFAVVGGLIISQALTLYTTPVVFLYLDRLSTWLAGDFRLGTARRADRPLTSQASGSVDQHAAD